MQLCHSKCKTEKQMSRTQQTARIVVYKRCLRERARRAKENTKIVSKFHRKLVEIPQTCDHSAGKFFSVELHPRDTIRYELRPLYFHDQRKTFSGGIKQSVCVQLALPVVLCERPPP